MILKSIYLDKLFLFFVLIIILTGNFNYFIPYFSLLFIHEMGHTIGGILLGYKPERIVFYPLGGITIFNFPLNISLKKELFILVMGPIFQILGYLFLLNYFPFIKTYHYTLLIFNLLPLYPLDGGKILNILCAYFNSYLTSFKITFTISLLVIVGLFIYNIYFFNINLFLMLIMMIIKLKKEYYNCFFYYQRFLLERYLYNYKFSKVKNVSSLNNFYRDYRHYINFMEEKEALNKYFKYK